MKKGFISIVCVVMLSLISCGGMSTERQIEGAEGGMVRVVKKELKNSKGTLADYEVVTGVMPAALYADDLKKERDMVNKARLDYQSCKTRGISQGMEKALAVISECQESIKQKVSELDSAENVNYVMILATSDEKGVKGSTYHYIAIFDEGSKALVKWIPITTPIYNNAVMIANAERGTLAEYETESGNIEELREAVDNPVVKFILSSNPK